MKIWEVPTHDLTQNFSGHQSKWFWFLWALWSFCRKTSWMSSNELQSSHVIRHEAEREKMFLQMNCCLFCYSKNANVELLQKLILPQQTTEVFFFSCRLFSLLLKVDLKKNTIYTMLSAHFLFLLPQAGLLLECNSSQSVSHIKKEYFSTWMSHDFQTTFKIQTQRSVTVGSHTCHATSLF